MFTTQPLGINMDVHIKKCINMRHRISRPSRQIYFFIFFVGVIFLGAAIASSGGGASNSEACGASNCAACGASSANLLVAI